MDLPSAEELNHDCDRDPEDSQPTVLQDAPCSDAAPAYTSECKMFSSSPDYAPAEHASLASYGQVDSCVDTQNQMIPVYQAHPSISQG